MRIEPKKLALAAALWVLGVIGCVLGAIFEPEAFSRAWLCGFLFWLGVPLAGVTLVLVHDLSGGDWMEAARAPLNAAIATMPIASLAGIIAFIHLPALYSWTHPAPDLGNVFYLNPKDFFIRYGVYVLLWNLLATYALLGPRQGRAPISPGLSWISGLGLVALAFSASFAAIDWILSLEPKFWSSVFPYTQAASWFNTGMAMVVLAVALTGWPASERRAHMADLVKILLATSIFWAYVEFMQFLIIWEENLTSEIPWYLKRIDSAWMPAIYVSAALGFIVPFFVWLWAPPKRNRVVVATICLAIVLSRVGQTWLLVLPEFGGSTPIWLDLAALLAVGGFITLLFVAGWRYAARFSISSEPVWTADHA
jgi:hypothetical protein